MTQKTEQELFLEYSKTKDESIRNLLVEKNLYIAEILAKKMSGRGVDYNDLYQVACLALIGAVQRFDVSKGLKFSTFATPSILGELKNYFRDKSRVIKMGRAKNQLALDIKKFVEKYSATYGKSPTYNEIAEELDCEVADVIEILEFNKGVMSLDSKINDESTELYEMIADENDHYDNLISQMDLKTALAKLDTQEKQLIKLRFFDELSQVETAKKMDVSQMYVSRLERKIVEKLRKNYLNA